MQFAGQRTDEDFNPIGNPDNWLIKLTPEILPEPEAIMITGITPQKTIAEGISEPEFLELLMTTVFTPGTTALGYNSIRFDDEFVRYTLYRNFYDAYEREWSDNRSRWDIVDLVRMTRALRPDGIEWPNNEDGKATNRLEKLSAANGIAHEDAHDALSDVRATIAVAKLVREKQPKLFDHLVSLRDKKKVKKLIDEHKGKAMVHSSSKYGSENQNTSVVIVLATHPTNSNAVLAYDLRHSPKQFQGLSQKELAELTFTSYRELAKQGKVRLPVKAIHMNKSPALAPIGVLDEKSQERINLPLDKVQVHLDELAEMKAFPDLVAQAWESNEFPEEQDVDAKLYDSFLNDQDRKLLQQVRNRTENKLADWHPNFDDDRMNELLLRYKAKHFPTSLTPEEKAAWDQYRAKRINGGLGPTGLQAYSNKLVKLAGETKDKQKLFLLEELRLYVESIAPYENETLV